MAEREHRSLLRKLTANARAIISDQIGLSVGVRKMCNILLWLEPYERVKAAKIDVFAKYDDETRLIPTGAARLHCSREAFKKYDDALEKVNQKLRARILEACFEIIDKYGERNIT